MSATDSSTSAPPVGAGTPTREVRVALVLYGGVSLAVYENGVCHAFHDLVRDAHGMGVLNAVLGARAVVDVVAGTSAGGINGLMLAACLESGQEFKQTARIWRVAGDLEALLRKPGSPDPVSLLDGEGYYQRELYRMFAGLVRPTERPPATQELDLFITGTDFEGRAVLGRDTLGQSLSDLTHRVVFHAKHRPGREWLGVWVPDEERDPGAPGRPGQSKATEVQEHQALVLSSLARITSAFPAAFPPFRARALRESLLPGLAQGPSAGALAAAVRSLELLAEHGLSVGTRFQAEPSHVPFEDRAFVDGGVLDNKPFGPALRAIFQRMASGPVTRVLFYVEPHPTGPRPAAEPHPGGPHLLEVALRSLVSIPRHEEFASELEGLDRHNAKVNGLEAVHRDARARVLASESGADELLPLYRRLRVEALAKALLWSSGDLPTAQTALPEGLDCRRHALEAALAGAGGLQARLDALDRWDPEYHLRGAFRLLYSMYAVLDPAPKAGASPLDCAPDGPTADATKTAATTPDPRWDCVAAIGRVIKMLKTIRAACLDLRDRWIREWPSVQRSTDGRLQLDPRSAARLAEQPPGPGVAGPEALAAEIDRRACAALIAALQAMLDRDTGPFAELGKLGEAAADLESRPAGARAMEFSRNLAPRVKWPTTAAQALGRRGGLEAPLASETIGRLRLASKREAATGAGQARAAAFARTTEPRSVLEALAQVVAGIATEFDGPSGPVATETARFRQLDAATYPAQYLSGLASLDRVRFARVSPLDPTVEPGQGGGTEPRGMDKVAGDELGHFSALLRRDWRSNDLLWGRLDGICQIVRMLLDEEERRGFTPHRWASARQAVETGLEQLREKGTSRYGVPHAMVDDAQSAWKALATGSPPTREAWGRFRDRLILVLQAHAAEEEEGIRGVMTDHHFQEVKWEQASLPEVTPLSSDDRIEHAAQEKVRSELGSDDGFHGRWRRFVGAGLGLPTRPGRTPWVPVHIAALLLSRSYTMLWAALEVALRRRLRNKAPVLGSAQVKLVLLRPVQLIAWSLGRLREGRLWLLLLVWAPLFALLGAVVVAWSTGSRAWFWGSVAGLFAIPLLLMTVLTSMRTRGLVRGALLVVSALVVGGVAYLATQGAGLKLELAPSRLAIGVVLAGGLAIAWAATRGASRG